MPTEEKTAYEQLNEYQKQLAQAEEKIEAQLKGPAEKFLEELEKCHLSGSNGVAFPTAPQAIEVDSGALRGAIAKGTTIKEDKLLVKRDYGISAEEAIRIARGDDPEAPRGVGGLYYPVAAKEEEEKPEKPQSKPAHGGGGHTPVPPASTPKEGTRSSR